MRFGSDDVRRIFTFQKRRVFGRKMKRRYRRKPFTGKSEIFNFVFLFPSPTRSIFSLVASPFHDSDPAATNTVLTHYCCSGRGRIHGSHSVRGDDFRDYIHTHTFVWRARPARVLKKPQYPRRDHRYFRRSINGSFFFHYFFVFFLPKRGILRTLTGTETTGNNNNDIHTDRHMLGWASLDRCTRERARTHARRKLRGTHTHERCIVSVSAHSSCNYVRFVFCFYFRYYSVFFLVSFYQQLVAQQATTYISSYLRLALSEKPASNRARPFKAAALIGLCTRYDFETGSRAGKVHGKVARMCSGA